MIVEMGPQVIHHGGDLIVAHHRSERWHCALSVDDEVDGIPAGLESLVGHQRWIGSGAYRPLAVGHVAAPTDIGEQLLAAAFNEPEAGAQG